MLAPDLPAVATARQHEAVLPVVQVQPLLREGLAPLPAEDAQAAREGGGGGDSGSPSPAAPSRCGEQRAGGTRGHQSRKRLHLAVMEDGLSPASADSASATKGTRQGGCWGRQGCPSYATAGGPAPREAQSAPPGLLTNVGPAVGEGRDRDSGLARQSRAPRPGWRSRFEMEQGPARPRSSCTGDTPAQCPSALCCAPAVAA